jgi:hypothetical protein
LRQFDSRLGDWGHTEGAKNASEVFHLVNLIRMLGRKIVISMSMLTRTPKSNRKSGIRQGRVKRSETLPGSQIQQDVKFGIPDGSNCHKWICHGYRDHLVDARQEIHNTKTAGRHKVDDRGMRILAAHVLGHHGAKQIVADGRRDQHPNSIYSFRKLPFLPLQARQQPQCRNSNTAI